MATTQNTFNGNGSNLGPFSFTFKWLESTDIKVSVGGVLKTAGTHYNLQGLNYTTKTGGQVLFTAGNAPPAGTNNIRIYRDTDDEVLSAVFSSGSAIRAKDLNDNFTQNLYVTQEVNNNAVNIDGSNPMAGNLNLNNFKVVNLGTPTVATDASTKGYVDSVIATGAANAAAAASSASAAAGSATAAANSLDSFDDRYLGAKTTDPLVDNDGNALLVGAIYFNSTSKVMRVWNGANWQDSSANANVLRWRKTAVGGETALSGNDNSSQSLTYTVNLETVFLNGALLQRGVDYVATTGNSITGLVALTAGDVVEVLAFSQVSLLAIPSSTVTFTQSGTGSTQRTVESKLKDVVSVKDFGAVGDGIADDTAAIQAAINAAIQQRRSLYLPRTPLGLLGLYRVTAPLVISGPILIYGDGTGYSGLLCSGCSGFRINAGVNYVIIEQLAIIQATRYSVTPNTFKAIETFGTTGSRNFWHVYRDLFIDGFEWALRLSWTWSTVINNVISVYSYGGIKATGTSVNNFVSNCSLEGSGAIDSAGIEIGDGTIPTEGWMIQDSLLSRFARGVIGSFASNCHVRGCIIDFFKEHGVLLVSSASGGSTNWIISDNYMATDGAAATGIYLLNNFSASADQHRGTVVSNNQILAYSGCTLTYGIIQAGSAEDNNIITGNRIVASVYACRITAGSRTVVANNRWKTGVFETDVTVNYYGNEGTMSSSPVTIKQSNGNRSFYYNVAAPSTGTYLVGDIVWNFSPSPGATPGWVCTTAGSPGTWKAMANLAL